MAFTEDDVLTAIPTEPDRDLDERVRDLVESQKLTLTRRPGTNQFDVDVTDMVAAPFIVAAMAIEYCAAATGRPVEAIIFDLRAQLHAARDA